MLEIGINNVTKNFGFKNVLDGASFEVMSGERVALVGRNGTGKTTLLRIISGAEVPTKGEVSIRRGAAVGYLEQIPELQSTEMTPRQMLMEPFAEQFDTERQMRLLEAEMGREADSAALEKLMNRYARCQERFESIGGYDIEENLSRVTAGFGLTELLDRPFNVLSGGQKTVVKLAVTLLRQPDILLLDEPTNHLDVSTLEWFEGFLSKYRGTALIVSHDRYFLDRVATKTVCLESGTCATFNGNYSFSVKERERLLLIEFEHYRVQQKKIEAMRAAIKRFREWAARSDNAAFYKKAKELEKRIERMEILERPQLEPSKIPIRFAGERTGNEALKFADAALAIGGLTLLTDVNFIIRYRERACLMGDNGSGKTTLIRAILGEIPLAAGTFTLANSTRIGYIPQEIRFADDKLSILDEFRRECVCTEGEGRNILARYLFFGDQVFKRLSALSGGEKVLLKLAVQVHREVNLLIMDEPTNHIDIETREMLEEALQDYTGTLLFVSHDRYFIRKIATRILEIKDRSILSFAGTYENYRGLPSG